jgi:hypothetical protein
MGQGVAERTYLRRIFTDEQTRALGSGSGTISLSSSDPDLIPWMVAAHNSGWDVDVNDFETHIGHKPDTRWERWHEVAHRVALGNVSLLKTFADTNINSASDLSSLWRNTAVEDYTRMAEYIANGSLLMSGRHLQQGDARQPHRNMEIVSNCATSPTSFGLFMLLLNGAGVGRDYTDTMMVVDWAAHMPNVVPVLSDRHKDFQWGKHTSKRDAQHLYGNCGDNHNVLWFTVPDSREGWAKAVEYVETTTYRNAAADGDYIAVLILDFSEVRGHNEPIMGMQGRPSSGPAPLMEAMVKIALIRGTGMKPWLSTLYIDHYLAEPVLVGGARRSARMSTKWWQDDDIIDFIGIKRPVEYTDLSMDEVLAYRDASANSGNAQPTSFLWSSNNSVTVDKDFWRRVKGPVTSDPLTIRAKAVYEHTMACGYGDGTGEPAFINVDRLSTNMDGFDDSVWQKGEYVQSDKFVPSRHTKQLLGDLFSRFYNYMPYHFIVNPCGEIVLSLLGGFCVIADIVPFYCDTKAQALDVAKSAARALIRANTMDSVYNAEVQRTNRIGVGVTGIHEAAWKFFRCGFNDLVSPDFALYIQKAQAHADGGIECDLDNDDDARVRSAAFWEWLGTLSASVRSAATEYAKELGVTVPHTFMTVKPSGSVSKLFGLTEGWHLPAMRQYIRWVQYHKDSPLLGDYKTMGYPVRELKTYRDHYIVGFPTEPTLCSLTGIDQHIVTAADASMDDQFTWIRLGEFFLMEGGTANEWVAAHGNIDNLANIRSEDNTGNQISYTMKYNPQVTEYHQFCKSMLSVQGVRCVSVMPQEKSASYEYLPEQPVSAVEYQEVLMAINRADDSPSEDVGLEHLDCATGACPIVFDTAAKEDL